MIYIKPGILFVLISSLLISCGSYRQNIILRPEKTTGFSDAAKIVERNYVIQSNDFLQVDVFTNDGERIIDPDLKLAENIRSQGISQPPEPKYLVNVAGIIKLPMIGELKVTGMTVRELESILQKEYQKFYNQPYVIVTFTNKRVVVLGTSNGKVVPLTEENVRLAEILALSESVTERANVKSVRIVRGQELMVADLSSFETFQRDNIIIQPGDIIYVEPIRKPFLEFSRDYGSFLSTIVSLAAIIIVLTN